MDGVDNWRDGDSVGRQLYAGLTSPAGQTRLNNFMKSKLPFLLRINSIFHSLIIIFVCPNKNVQTKLYQTKLYQIKLTHLKQTKLDQTR